jgi:hypothetical protein
LGYKSGSRKAVQESRYLYFIHKNMKTNKKMIELSVNQMSVINGGSGLFPRPTLPPPIISNNPTMPSSTGN